MQTGRRSETLIPERGVQRIADPVSKPDHLKESLS
jgi:hypothetical protein